MTLECTVIGVSGSRAMTNEDLSNTRHYYQTQVVEKVGSSKFSLNPENTVSLLDMSQVQMILHNARNNSDIMRILHSVRYGMPIFLHESIRTAMQALKHRPDMNQRQRIVLIIDSSLKLDPEDQESIMKLTKTIKKLKINVDIIIIGTECSLKDFFTEFIKNVNGPDNLSGIFFLDSGNSFKDFRISNIVKYYKDNATDNLDDNGDIGVDDPQLALALKLSLEDQFEQAKKQ